MDSRAKLAGHPIHQMLIVFPLGLLATSIGFDIVHWLTGNGYWSGIAYWLILVGVASGLIAAVFGLVDFLAIPGGTRAKRVGALHGGGNVVVVALFALSWLLRRPDPLTPPVAAYALSIGGAVLATVTGWLGGELVDRLGVGVDEGANLNAPSSLSGRAATRAAPAQANPASAAPRPFSR